jgi:CRISPR-associated protein Csh1
LNDIESQRAIQYQLLQTKEEELKTKYKENSDKQIKSQIKDLVNQVQEEIKSVQPLNESDYILFYLDVANEAYKNAHGKYLDDKLFNTSNYNTEPDNEGVIYGTNDFQNGYNSNIAIFITSNSHI